MRNRLHRAENKDIHNNGAVGFVDPATQEYDEHLYRCDDGTIKPLTDVGKYMVKVFCFDIRVMDIIWKASQLYERLDKLQPSMDSLDTLTAEERDELLRLLVDSRELDGLIFGTSE